jgi:hypothetical protein
MKPSFDYNVGFAAPDALPTELKHLKAFLYWRLTPARAGEKKPRKVPYYANGTMRSGVQGEAADLDNLASYAEAVAAGQRNGSTGIGMAILPQFNIVATDFDNVVVDGVINPEVESLCTGTYTEFSPSGTGIRSFFRGSAKSRKDTTGEHGNYALEVFGDSGFVTITGNVTPLCDLLGESDVVAPLSDDVIAEYESRWGALQSAGTAVALQTDDDAWLLNLGMRKGWTPEEGRDILMDCDPSCGRDHWVKAAMAMHFEFEGSEQAFDIFHEWSKLGKSYAGPKDVESIWRSFRRSSGGQITGVWLLAWRKECQKRGVYTQVEGWKAEINAVTTEYDLREKLAVKIAEDGALGDVERQILAQSLQDAFKRLGVKLPIASCRKMLVQKRNLALDSNSNIMSGDHYPEWLRGYVYVTEDDKFHQTGTDEYLTAQGFNSKFNRYMPRDAAGMVTIAASVMALEQYQIPTVIGARYFPMCGEIFEYNRSQYVNSYQRAAVPVADEVLSKDGTAAVSLVQRHIRLLLCSDREAEYTQFMSWLAHNVKNPGKKIRWAPLIKGIEGDGKSVICELLKLIMGDPNVKSIGPTVIGTDFTSWAEGACIGFLEEIRVTGHNRYEILNTLKPFITNDSVEIHKKGKDACTVPNTMNYIGATNHTDALPINDLDRRWFILFTQFTTKESLNEYLKQFGGRDLYFDSLHIAIYEHAGAIRRYFLDYPLSSDFKPNGHAPATAEKELMVAMSVSEEEQIIKEIVDAGAIGVTETVLLSKALTNAWPLDESASILQTYALNQALKKSGWMRLTKRMRWNKFNSYVWTMGRVPNGNPPNFH